MQNAYVLALFLCLGTTILFAQKQTPSWKAESRQTKLSVDILQFRQAYRQFYTQRGNTADFEAPNPAITHEGGGITVEVIVRDRAVDLLPAAKALGMSNCSAFGSVLNGSIPVEKLDQLSGLSEVISVNPVYDPVPNIGTATTQGDRAQYTDLVRRVFQVDGSGIKVGVLSDSYNYLGGAAASVAAGDLPGPGNPNGYEDPVDVLADNGTTDEGRAMLEVIHDIAPGAELAFSTAKGGSAAFAQNIINLARVANCNIIVDDIIYKSSPFFQDGIAAKAVDSVRAMGVTYFTSAGNQAGNSYQAAFVQGDNYHLEFVDTYGRNYSADLIRHDFAPGDALQSIRIPRGGSLSLVLQWADRYTSVSGLPGPETDLDFFLLSADGTKVLASSININSSSDPVEQLTYTNTTNAELQANLMIGLVNGPAPSLMKYVSYGSFLANEYFSGASTCIGHANAAGAITVGAVSYLNTPEFTTSTPLLQSYSSRGGTPVMSSAADARAHEAIVRNKPNIVAPDGGDNSFFGGDVDGSGRPNFFGTSAAAPHAAGIAALLLQLDGRLTPDGIRQALEQTALDMTGAGFDYDSGWGLVNGFQATLREARYASKVHIANDEERFPGRQFTGNGSVETDMAVKSQFRITAGSEVRLLPGFKAVAGTTFSARVDPSVIINRPQPASETYRTIELRAAPLLANTVSAAELPGNMTLQAYPNPFRTSTRIDFQLEQDGTVSLQLLDASGREVSQIVAPTFLPKGFHSYTLDGSELPSGPYFLVMKGAGERQIFQMIRS